MHSSQLRRLLNKYDDINILHNNGRTAGWNAVTYQMELFFLICCGNCCNMTFYIPCQGRKRDRSANSNHLICSQSHHYAFVCCVISPLSCKFMWYIYQNSEESFYWDGENCMLVTISVNKKILVINLYRSTREHTIVPNTRGLFSWRGLTIPAGICNHTASKWGMNY